MSEITFTAEQQAELEKIIAELEPVLEQARQVSQHG